MVVLGRAAVSYERDTPLFGQGVFAAEPLGAWYEGER